MLEYPIMTKEMEALAQKHIKGFLVGQGLPDPHADYLRSHLTPEELAIGGNTLIQDPDARRVLIKAYRELGGHKNYVRSRDNLVANEIAKQINLVRSSAMYGVYGYLED